MKLSNIKILAAAVLAITTLPATASFHTWDFNEFYSNADGSIQYIEFFEANGSNGQDDLADADVPRGIEFLANPDDGTRNVYGFKRDLPSDQTANKTFVIGTPGFEAAFGVKPDFFMDPNLMIVPNGTMNFGLATIFGADSVSYTGLPTDGSMAMDHNGNIVTPSPTNFAGQTGSLPAVPVPAAVWLLGSGLLAMAGVVRRRA